MTSKVKWSLERSGTGRPLHEYGKGRIVHTFDEEALRHGDILLSTNPTSKRSAVIRAATRSPYSHAAICYSPPEFLEATPEGVSRFNTAGYFVGDLSRVAVLRLRTRPDDSGDTAKRAAVEATRYLGNDYWALGALTALAQQTPQNRLKRVFCSHFVATVYEAVGVKLVPAKTTDKVSPGDLARAQAHLLESVADKVLKPLELSVAQLLGLTSILNMSHGRPHNLEIIKAREVRDQVNRWLSARALHEEANFYQLLNVLRDSLAGPEQQDMDKVFAMALETTGYLKVLRDNFPDDDPVFEIHSLLKSELVHGALTNQRVLQLAAHYRSQSTLLEGALTDQSRSLEWYQNAWENRRLETFRLLADNQRQVCEGSRRLLEGLRSSLHTCDEYVQAPERRDP